MSSRSDNPNIPVLSRLEQAELVVINSLSSRTDKEIFKMMDFHLKTECPSGYFAIF